MLWRNVVTPTGPRHEGDVHAHESVPELDAVSYTQGVSVMPAGVTAATLSV